MVGWRRWAMAGALFAATCAVFAPTLGGGFIQLDDAAYVTANPVVRGGLSLRGVVRAFATDTASLWVPASVVSHMLDVSLWGFAPAGHHLTNVVLHALNATLVFLLLSSLTAAPWRSAAVALLFAVHPLRVESVAWIAERKDLLSTTFALLTIAAYVGQVRRPSAARAALTAALYALALLAKPMVVTLPVLLLLLDVWPLARTDVPLRARVREKLPLVVLAALTAAATVLVVGRTGGTASLDAVPLGTRAANAVVACVRYLAATLWPVDLAVYYPLPPPWPATTVAGAVVLLGGLAATAAWLGRRIPAVAVGCAWFAIALLPVSGLVQAGMQGMADRFTYLPSIGLALAAVWLVATVAAARPRLRWAAAPATLLVAGALAVATQAAIVPWRSNRTLFDHALAVTERNWFVHASYGDALLAEGALDEAVAHYAAALAIEPRIPFAHSHWGAILLGRGDVDGAVAHLAEALRLELDDATAAANLAAALGARGLPPAEARAAVERLRAGTRDAFADRDRPLGEQYHAAVLAGLMRDHADAVGRCWKETGPSPAFDLFITVGATGTVAEADASPPSALARCLTGALTGATLPRPPFAPFHARVPMRFGA